VTNGFRLRPQSGTSVSFVTPRDRKVSALSGPRSRLPRSITEMIRSRPPELAAVRNKRPLEMTVAWC
jgi:hypothetical protein